MADSLELLGWKVIDPTPQQAFGTRADIVHMHWPQAVVSAKWPLAIRRTAMLLAILLVQKARGAKIVWTAHNLRAHASPRPQIERFWMGIVTRLLDGVVFLSEYSRSEAWRLFPQLAQKPMKVVPHGVYGNAYPASVDQGQAQAHWGLSAERPIVGFVGEIKPYKGLRQLITAFTQTSPGTLSLLIAGKFPQNAHGSDLKSLIDAARAEGHSIIVHDQRLDNDQLIKAVLACDLIALPYLKGENSGLAILASEKDRALLLPNEPRYDELSSQIETNLIYRYGNLSGPVIQDATQHARLAIRTGYSNDAFRALHDWKLVAQEISRLYLNLKYNK